MMPDIRTGVSLIDRCELSVCEEPWPFALEHAAAIEAHWLARRLANPAFFNGVVHILRDDAARCQGTPACFVGGMWRSDFKSFLYWRDLGWPDANAADCFGSIILRSAEGHVLLGRQRAGLNAGMTYLPSGLIDASDVRPGGAIDIDGSIVRELTEETGLEALELERGAGYLLTRCGPLVSIGVTFTSPLEADALRADILARISSDPEPELGDILIVRSLADLAGHRVPEYTRIVLANLLGGAGP